ncbi:MAG: SRPBCC family protein [candidate division KSB1 bacterium]|nr:SRPBCC family protein [candidate division KSB1 bacterium]MDZ7366622.1 SRPBCC family protein [candidate division KSB1 bacterium]MDZ7404633.1 SRPBCC family protein [candidate division KSB1 bacterium]
MPCSRFLMLLTLALLVVAANSSAQVANKKLTGQSFGGEITVNASPQAVWAVITDVQKLSSALGFEHKGAPKKLEKVGDNVPLKVWGDTGTYILIYAKPGNELRFVWEPDNATYICQERWTLTPAGKGTKLTYEERYTESGSQSADAIAEQVKSYNQALAKIKAMCEGK